MSQDTLVEELVVGVSVPVDAVVYACAAAANGPRRGNGLSLAVHEGCGARGHELASVVGGVEVGCQSASCVATSCLMHKQFARLGITQFIAVGALLMWHEYLHARVVPVEVAHVERVAVSQSCAIDNAPSVVVETGCTIDNLVATIVVNIACYAEMGTFAPESLTAGGTAMEPTARELHAVPVVCSQRSTTIVATTENGRGCDAIGVCHASQVALGTILVRVAPERGAHVAILCMIVHGGEFCSCKSVEDSHILRTSIGLATAVEPQGGGVVAAHDDIVSLAIDSARGGLANQLAIAIAVEVPDQEGSGVGT